MAAVTFFFQGKDNTTKVFKSVNKSFKDMNKQIKTVTKTLKSLQSAFSGALGVITGVLKGALNLAVNLVKRAISAIKSLVKGVFSFVKSALSTLLSWMKSALGKIFDWIKNTFSKVAKTTIETAKKTVKTIVSAVQAYADKEYNTIQLRIAYNDSDFKALQSGFQDLLRYTTADRNDLWGSLATYAEMGKTAQEALKYARATVYLSNATGKSLDTITRMLLMQEAMGRDIDRTLAKVGVKIDSTRVNISAIDKIIEGMGPEMEALTNSLNQSFANVKNNWILVKESIGSLFAGPVQYVADKLASLLEKLNTTVKNGKPLIDALWDTLKPIVDKIFEFFEKFVKDPEGFLRALWADIQTIVKNFWNNLGNYFKIAGYMIGKAISAVIDAIDSMDFKGFEKIFEDFSDLISNFSISVGLGAGWFEAQDVVENSFRKTFINAWNTANKEFQMSADDPWYKNLCTLLDAAWSGIKDWWDTSETVTSLKTNLSSWWHDTAVPVLKTTFEWLGEVIGAAFSNFLLNSAVLRKIMSAIGMPIATTADQQAAYDAYKKFLPQTAIHGNVWDDFGPADITPEFLNSKYKGNGFTGTWKQYLETVGDVTGDALDQMRRIARADEITQEKVVPTFTDLANRIEAALNPVKDAVEAAEETQKTLEPVQLQKVISGAVEDAVESVVQSTTFQVTPIAGGSSKSVPLFGGMGGGGGIQDYFSTSNEFKIKPYSDGGPAGLNGPEIALLGENGPEYVIPNSALRRTTGGGGINSIEGSFLNKQGVWVKDTWLNRMLDDLGIISEILTLITKDTSELAKWWAKPDVVEEVTHHDYELKIILPWYKYLAKGLKAVVSNIGKVVGKSVGFLAEHGAFGSHIGNIWGGIKQDIDNGDFSIWKAIGHVLEELLPYLEKGLEVVGKLFDEAFEILGNAVSILGERISNLLLPILEAFVPLMKEIADILIALSPVIEAVLQPAITVIAAILRALVPILDMLMPAFAGIGAVIQWVSDAISWAIGSFLNWLGDIHIGDWYPFAGAGGNSVKKPTSIKENYNSIMGAYNEAKNNSATGVTSSVSVAGQTASYSGASHVYITNDFAGAYLVGSDGFRELAQIIKNEFEEAGYSRQNL